MSSEISSPLLYCTIFLNTWQGDCLSFLACCLNPLHVEPQISAEHKPQPRYKNSRIAGLGGARKVKFDTGSVFCWVRSEPPRGFDSGRFIFFRLHAPRTCCIVPQVLGAYVCLLGFVTMDDVTLSRSRKDGNISIGCCGQDSLPAMLVPIIYV